MSGRARWTAAACCFVASALLAGPAEAKGCKGMDLPRDQLEQKARRVDPGDHDNGVTLMMCVALSDTLSDADKLAIAQLLARPGADFNVIDANGNTALHFAARKQAPLTAAFLMDHGADPDQPDAYGVTALAIAINTGNVELARVFIPHSRYADTRDAMGRTPLHDAASRGDLPVVRLLVAHGADYRASRQGVLAGAAAGGHADVVNYLISDAKLPVDARDANGETALMAVAAAGLPDMAKMLVETHHADPQIMSSAGATALSMAARAGRVDLVGYLLAHGATMDRSRPSAIAAAAAGGRMDVVNLLLDAHADIGPGSTDSPGVLYWAVLGGNAAIVDRLIERDAAYPSMPADIGLFFKATIHHRMGQHQLAKGDRATAREQLAQARASYLDLNRGMSEQASELRRLLDRQEMLAGSATQWFWFLGNTAFATSSMNKEQALRELAGRKSSPAGAADTQSCFTAFPQLVAPLGKVIEPRSALAMGSGRAVNIDTSQAWASAAAALDKAVAACGTDITRIDATLQCIDRAPPGSTTAQCN